MGEDRRVKTCAVDADQAMVERALEGTAAEQAAALRDELDRLEYLLLDDRPSIGGQAIVAAGRAEALGLPSLAYRAQVIEGVLLGERGENAASGRIAQAVHQWAEQTGDRFLQARAHCMLSTFFQRIGDHPQAIDHGVRGVELLDDDVSPQVVAMHHQILSVALVAGRCWGAARERWAIALEHVVRTGSTRMHLTTLNNLAFLEVELGNLDEAQRLCDQVLHLSRERDYALPVYVRDTLAQLYLAQQRPEAAVELLADLLDPDVSWGTMSAGLAETLVTLARAYRVTGRFDRAVAAIERCQRLADEEHLSQEHADALRELAEVWAAQGDFEQAFECFKRFHAEVEQIRSVEREARLGVLQAVFQTEEARRESMRFRQMSYRDALTGLYNRRYVDEQLPLLAREPGARLAVALLDLDHFKAVNDTLSHQVGDVVLRTVAGLLAGEVRSPAFVARFGGEEFIVVLPGQGARQAVDVCERLRAAIAGHHWDPVTGALPVTASFGVAQASASGDLEDLLQAADRQLYAAKHAGRNRVCGATD